MRASHFFQRCLAIACLLLSGLGLSHGQISVSIVETQSILCQGAPTGALQAVISPVGIGGTLQWSNGSVNTEINGLGPGIYSVTFTDFSGGQYSDSYELTEPEAISITSLQVFPLKVFSTGDILVDISGGTPGYTYEWKDLGLQIVSTEEDLLAAGPGQYVLTVIDANGCRQSLGPLEIQLILPITVEIQVTKPIACNGEFNGELLAVHSSSLPVTYAWSSGHSSAEVFNAGADVYVVTVTDADGASAIATLQLEEPDPLVASTQQSFPMNVQSTSDIQIDVEGGTAPYLYRWENADQQEISDQEDLLGAGPGIYTLLVTDAHKCETSIGPLELVFTSGVQDATSAGILLYPNPAGAMLNIEMPQPQAWAYEIINATGSVVRKASAASSKLQISLSELPAGFYQVLIRQGSERYQSRLCLSGKGF